MKKKRELEGEFKIVYDLMMNGESITKKKMDNVKAFIDFLRFRKIKFSSKIIGPGFGHSKIYFMSEVDQQINKQNQENGINL